MGLVFKSEEERNPTNQPHPGIQGHGGVEAPKLDACALIKEERDLMNEFLEDMGHAVTYDLWKSAREEVKKMQAQYNENGGFEEVE